MLIRANELAPADAPVSFVQGDAMVHHFKAASRNLVISRLGMMYFADPVRAVLNIRTALRSEGRLAFACWRDLRDNPWALEPLQAVYDHVPKLPGLPPHAPDDFAFASPEWVEHVLSEAGLRRIRLERRDIALDLSGGEGSRWRRADRARVRAGRPGRRRTTGRGRGGRDDGGAKDAVAL